MKESMPSSAQPAHAAKNPRIWFGVSGVGILREYTDMRVLLAPHGSRGDVQPMLALASALRDRGHVASFIAPSNDIDWIRARGFEAEYNGIDVEALLKSAGADLSSLRWQMRHLADVVSQLFVSV